MASSISDLQDPAQSTSDSGGGGFSAFGFLNSGASAPPSDPLPTESAFSFLTPGGGGGEVAGSNPPSAFNFPSDGGNLGFGEALAQAPPVVSDVPSIGGAGGGSAFSFLGGSAPPAMDVAPMHVPVSGAAPVPVPESTGPKKRTRKAVMPGHAGRAAASELPAPAPPAPDASESTTEPPPAPPPPDPPANQEPTLPQEMPTATTAPNSITTTAIDDAASSTPTSVAVQQAPSTGGTPVAAMANSTAGDFTFAPPPRAEPAEVPMAASNNTSMMGSAFSFLQGASDGAPAAEGSPAPPPHEAPTAMPPPQSQQQRLQPQLPQHPFSPPPPPQPASIEKPQEPQAAPAEPPKSKEEKLKAAFNVSGVQQWLEHETNASTQDWRALLDEQAACLSMSQRKTEELEALRRSLLNTESDQNKLCEDEKFDEAGALDATIQELKDSIARRIEEVASVARRGEELSGKLLDLAHSREALTMNAFERVQVLQQESEEQLASTAERLQRRLASEEARLESEKKRVNISVSHLEKDQQNLSEEWQQVNEAIDQQTTEHTAERDQAKAQRAQLDAEIQQLQQSLDKKLLERATLSEAVDSAEIRIASIRSKFEKQLTRLEGKQRRVEEAEREVQQDSQQLQSMHEDLEQLHQTCREGAEQGRREIAEIISEQRRLRGMKRLTCRGVRLRTAWQTLLEPHREMLSKARQKWEQATRENARVAESSAAQETEAAKLRSQIDAVGLQLPALEAEKKRAVASRSFKEAGRLTEEIKKREQEQSTLETRLEALQQELATAREELIEKRQAEEAAQAELLEAEGAGAKEELRVLLRQSSDLEMLCRRLPSSSSDRRLYEQEIAVLQRSQEHFSSKFNIALDSLEEIPPDDDDAPESEANDSAAESTKEDEGTQAVSRDENGVTSNVSASTEAAAAAAEAAPSPPQPPDVEKEEEPAEAAPSPQPADPEELQQQYDELSQQLTDYQAREKSIDDEIQGAVEQDDFERAEELEEERKSMETSVEVVKGKLETVKAALDSCSGPDRTSMNDAAEPVDTSIHAEEGTAPDSAPTPNGCHLEEDAEGEHDAPSSTQEPGEQPEEEVAQVAQPPPPPPPPPEA